LFLFISAFEPVEEDLDWTKVYPELGDSFDGEGAGVNGMLSQKLDNLLQEATSRHRADGRILGNSIKNFHTAAEGLSVLHRNQLASTAIDITNK
jgi:ABC-type transporter Mla subunit MlaD